MYGIFTYMNGWFLWFSCIGKLYHPPMVLRHGNGRLWTAGNWTVSNQALASRSATHKNWENLGESGAKWLGGGVPQIFIYIFWNFHPRTPGVSWSNLTSIFFKWVEMDWAKGAMKSNKKCLENIQGGPLPVITWVITPITRVITPVTQLFSAIYRGYNSIYSW